MPSCVRRIREESFASVATLLIVLRLWRVVRIVNAAALGAKAQADRQLSVARAKVRNVVHALHKAQDKYKGEIVSCLFNTHVFLSACIIHMYSLLKVLLALHYAMLMHPLCTCSCIITPLYNRSFP